MATAAIDMMADVTTREGNILTHSIANASNTTQYWYHNLFTLQVHTHRTNQQYTQTILR